MTLAVVQVPFYWTNEPEGSYSTSSYEKMVWKMLAILASVLPRFTKKEGRRAQKVITETINPRYILTVRAFQRCGARVKTMNDVYIIMEMKHIMTACVVCTALHIIPCICMYKHNNNHPKNLPEIHCNNRLEDIALLPFFLVGFFDKFLVRKIG